MYSKIDIWQNRTARLLFILMCCFMPLYLDGRRYFSLPVQKWTFFVFSMILVTLFVIIIWGRRFTCKPRLTPQDKFDITDWAIIAFALVTLISTLFSPFREVMNIWVGLDGQAGRYDGAITQLSYVGIFFIISRWYKPREKDFMWFAIAAIVISLIGIFQFFGMDFFRLWPNHIPEHRVINFFYIHIRTTLGNTNTVSVYVTLTVLFFGFLFIRNPSKYRPLWLIASALSFWMWDIANADSGTIGIAAAMLLCIPFIIQNMKILGRTLILVSSWLGIFSIQMLFFEVIAIETRTASTILPFAGVFVLLLAIGLLLTKYGKELDPDAPPKWKLGVVLIAAFIIMGLTGVEILGRPDAYGYGTGVIYEAREVLHGNIRDEFGTNRIHIWRYALSTFSQFPLIGSGPDTFPLRFPAEAQWVFTEFYDTAHNEYIQYLIAQGILGLLAYLLFAVSLIVKSIRKAFSDPIIMAVLAAFAGYLAQAFFNISHPIASQILWVFAGILASRRLNGQGRPSS